MLKVLIKLLRRVILRRSEAIVVLEFSCSGKGGSRAYSMVVCRKKLARKLAARYYSLFPHYHSAKFRRSKQKLVARFWRG